MVASELVDFLKLLSTDDTVSAFFVLVITEGNGLFLNSGRDRVTGPETEGPLFFSATEPPLFAPFNAGIDGFSGKPPVLFLLITATEDEIREDPDPNRVDLAVLDPKPLFRSILPLLEPADPESFPAEITLDFRVFGTGFALSAHNCFGDSERSVFAAGSSLGFPGGSIVIYTTSCSESAKTDLHGGV